MILSKLSRRTLAAGGCAVALVAILTGIQLRGKPAEVFPVAQRDLLQTVVTTGRVTSLARVEIGSQILGTVAAVYVEAGDRVRTGQVLIRLRDDEARASLEQAQAVVRELEERLAQIGAVDGQVSRQRLHEAEATLRQARNTYERIKRLFDDGITSHADLDEALRARDVAASTVEREKLLMSNSRPDGSDIKQAGARLNQARAAAAVAREHLAKTIITAPGDGTVILRKVEAGDVVQPGASLMALSRPGRTQITAQVDEKNLGLLRPSLVAVGSADAYPDRTFSARVATVVPAVDAQRGTVEVRCDVADPPPYLVPDMTVSLEIEVARRPQVLTIPSETIRDAATAPWVMAARNGRAERRTVTLGIRGSGDTEVLKGLQAGETVLAEPDRITAGSRIRPVRSTRDGRGGGRTGAR